VRGNNDRGAWAEKIAHSGVLQVDEVLIHVVHDIAELGVDPAAGGFQVVVSGHSHKPAISERDGVLYLNPGSSGPRRFKLPVAAAELIVAGASVEARLTELKVDRAA
jgi:predicted phosphodiesterase